MANRFDFSEMLLSGKVYAVEVSDSNELVKAVGPVGDLSVGAQIHLYDAYRGKTAEQIIHESPDAVATAQRLQHQLRPWDVASRPAITTAAPWANLPPVGLSPEIRMRLEELKRFESDAREAIEEYEDASQTLKRLLHKVLAGPSMMRGDVPSAGPEAAMEEAMSDFQRASKILEKAIHAMNEALERWQRALHKFRLVRQHSE